MADHGICVIPGCIKPVEIPSRGWCRMHYARWHKLGDVNAPVQRMSRQGACLEWLNAHSDHEGDECLIWPFGLHRNGYAGNVQIEGKQILATRWMCWHRNGPPPTPKHHAAHVVCNNGRGACVHPGHLAWKTNLENEADKLVFGTLLMGDAHPNAKLTSEKVIEIRRLAAHMTMTDIAGLFGISIATASVVIRRKTWKHIP